MNWLTQMMHHRGPDGWGVARMDDVFLGHTRLSILGVDSESARQPARSESALMAYNGEIYNFRDIAKDLRRRGHEVSGDSDTEVLFVCLQHFGVRRTMAMIDGMFAFAYYDSRQKELILARDSLGERPLYWALAEHSLWFGSEIKALIATGEIDAAPNLARINDYFHTSKINGRQTMFRDVFEVEPGTFVRATDRHREPRAESYWRLEDTPSLPSQMPDDWTAGRFSDRFSDAVNSRLVSDVPVGILLSGGIDSNSITESVAAASAGSALHLLFADNANPEVSERQDVDLFVEHLRRNHPQVDIQFEARMIGMDDYFEKLDRISWFYDEPVQFANTPLLDGLCSNARDMGFKVLLSGEGSDELLYGYDRFARTSRLIRDSGGDKSLMLQHLYFGGGLHSVATIQELTGDVAESVESTEPWQWLEANAFRWPIDTVQQLFSQKYRMQTLLQRQDRAGMASGVELRVPFLSPAFVAWVNQLPQTAKYDPATGETKRILRQAFLARLPKRILSKRKDGFPSDMNVWLRGATVPRMIADLVEDPNGFCQSHLNGPCARKIVAEHASGAARHDVLVWMLLALEVWHRSFANGISTARAETRH